MQKPPFFLIGLGLSLAITTVIVGWYIIPNIIRSKISSKVQLVNGTETWSKWLNPGDATSILMKFHIFNTTNPDQVKRGHKPILEEFGPYIYEEKRFKEDVSINNSAGTVFYRPVVQFFFRPDLSNGTESDLFTVLNVPHYILTNGASKRSELEQSFFQFSILDAHPEEKLFIQRSVQQLLFGGWYVPMLKTLEDNTGRVIFQNHTFGFWYPKNDSRLNGVMEVKDGVKSPSDFGRVVSWQNEKKLKFWTGDSCNAINGTDGSIFPPFVERSRLVHVFSPDLCRSLYLTYTGDTQLGGIGGYRFGLPREMLEDPRINADNKCFCVDPGTKLENCLKSGAIQLSACRKGAPIVMSTAHFLDGATEYLNGVEGLKPDREKHLTFVDLEPNTGLILRAHKRIQLNILLKKNNISELYEDVPELVYPILWIDEMNVMSEKTIEGIQGLVFTPLNIVDIARWTLLGIGGLLVAVGLVMYFQRHNFKEMDVGSKSAK